MRHRAPRPLVDLRHRVPRATARLLGAAARRRPFQALVAVVVLSLAAGAYTAVSSVSDDSSARHAESTGSAESRDAGGAESRSFDRPSEPGDGQVSTAPPTELPTPTDPASSRSPAPATSAARQPTRRPSTSSSASASSSATPSASARAEDRTPPETSLSGDPSGDTAKFSFSANEPASFACSLDGAPFTACQSPTVYSNLESGWHTFAVRATDDAGNVDPSPSEIRWHAEAGNPEQ